MLNHIIKANKTVSLHTNNALLLRVRHYLVLLCSKKDVQLIGFAPTVFHKLPLP